MRPTAMRLRCAWCQREVVVEAAPRSDRWQSPFAAGETEYVCVMCRSQFNLPAVREEFRVITPPPLPATPPPPPAEPQARSWWKRVLRIG